MQVLEFEIERPAYDNIACAEYRDIWSAPAAKRRPRFELAGSSLEVLIQSGVPLRLPPHSKIGASHSARLTSVLVLTHTVKIAEIYSAESINKFSGFVTREIQIRRRLANSFLEIGEVI
jgi:hypothetical protein